MCDEITPFPKLEELNKAKAFILRKQAEYTEQGPNKNKKFFIYLFQGSKYFK